MHSSHTGCATATSTSAGCATATIKITITATATATVIGSASCFGQERSPSGRPRCAGHPQQRHPFLRPARRHQLKCCLWVLNQAHHAGLKRHARLGWRNQREHTTAIVVRGPIVLRSPVPAPNVRICHQRARHVADVHPTTPVVQWVCSCCRGHLPISPALRDGRVHR